MNIQQLQYFLATARHGSFSAAAEALHLRPAGRDEVLYVSADPERTRRRMTIRRLAEAPLILYDARWGDEDPTRRQLAGRAQRAGVRLEPRIEVEDWDVALDLVARR